MDKMSTAARSSSTLPSTQIVSSQSNATKSTVSATTGHSEKHVTDLITSPRVLVSESCRPVSPLRADKNVAQGISSNGATTSGDISVPGTSSVKTPLSPPSPSAGMSVGSMGITVAQSLDSQSPPVQSTNVTLITGTSAARCQVASTAPSAASHPNSHRITKHSHVRLHHVLKASTRTQLRRPRAVAFVVDFSASPSGLFTPLSAPENSNHGLASIIMRPERSLAMSSSARCMAKLASHERFGFGVRIRSPKELETKIRAKMLQASLNRAFVLQQRRLALQKRFSHLQRTALLLMQRNTLLSLKLKAKCEYESSAAAIKRQLFLQSRQERSAERVEHAQNIAMLKRLENAMVLRRSCEIEAQEDETWSEELNSSVEKGLDYTSGPVTRGKRKARINGRGTQAKEAPRNNDSSLDTLAKNERLKTTMCVEKRPLEGVNETKSQVSVRLLPAVERTDPSPLRRCSSFPMDLVSNAFSMTASGSALVQSQSPIAVSGAPSTCPKGQDSPAPTLCMRKDAVCLLPPITRYTLRELDVQEIIRNMQLRHDLIFDPDMQFRPNNDGDRGAAKAKRSECYWQEIESEASAPPVKWVRIPALVSEIKEILVELIPYSKAFETELNERIDVELTVQQLKHNTLNLLGTIEFIASHLHQYCAPCRDDLVDDVVALMRYGRATDALKKLMTVLELMKLDFANHHLRKLRPWILENACTYEWKCFKQVMQSKAVCVAARVSAGKGVEAVVTKRWLLTAKENAGEQCSVTEIYNEAFLNLVTSPEVLDPESQNRLATPETFWMDVCRLQSFHNDWQDISIVCTLLLIFRQSAGARASAFDVLEMKRILWILLNDSETAMANVTLQLCQNAATVRGTKFSKLESSMLSSLVDKTLSFENKMYDLVQRNVMKRLLFCLNNDGRLEDSAALGRYGLAELEDEIRDLGERLFTLARHNRHTFSVLYDNIFERGDAWVPGP